MRVKKRQQKARENKVIALVSAGATNKQVLQVMPEIKTNTLIKIKQNKEGEIQAKKERYIKLIDKAIGGDKKQSKVLANILKAKTDIYNFKGDIVGVRPDYKVRLEAIKYIDKLKGREQQSIKLNQTNNYINKELDKYLS